MPSDKAHRYLQHIVENAVSIFRYTEGMDFAQFESDRKTYDVVERCLQRITAAVIRLGEQAELLIPEVPWHHVRGFGNRLRHDYDSIEEDRLFEIVRTDLLALSAHAQSALEKLRDSSAN